MVQPRLIEVLEQLEGLDFAKLTYPYVYGDLLVMKLFVYFRVLSIVAFKAMYEHLKLRPEVLMLMGLSFPPHRTTLSRRFKAMPSSIQDVLRQLTEGLLTSEQIEAGLGAVDASLMQANGKLWHKKQMETGELPRCGNVDVEARWGKSGYKGWVFGYGLHTLLLAHPMAWPCAFAVSPANRKEAPVLRQQLLPQLPQNTLLLLADGGYDDEQAALNCEAKDCTLLSSMPQELGQQASELRRERHQLYHSTAGREAFALRKTSIEPFQGQLKELFGLERLPIKGLRNVTALCAFSILTYCLLVKFNLQHNHPPTQIKSLLYSLR